MGTGRTNDESQNIVKNTKVMSRFAPVAKVIVGQLRRRAKRVDPARLTLVDVGSPHSSLQIEIGTRFYGEEEGVRSKNVTSLPFYW